jgi:hypothetical protein
MRAVAYALLLSAWALTAGCLGAPKAADWLAVGFRTPEQTFRTFQTGLRAGLPDLEYRCLGADFKQRAGGLSLLGYAEFRRELFRRNWMLKYAAKAKIKAVRELSPDHVQIEAVVDVWFHHETFAVDFVREDFYELYADGERIADDVADWDRIARERNDDLVVSVPFPSGRKTSDLGELRAGREWKIDGFPLTSQAPMAAP